MVQVHKMPRRRSISLASILVSIIFLGLFLFLPILRLIFPRLNSYLGFIPVFFFLPFFWSFRGRKRYSRAPAKDRTATTDDSTEYSSSGWNSNDSDGSYYDPKATSRSALSYSKYLAMALVIAFGVVLYFVLV